MAETIKIDGLRELKRALRQLPKNLQVKELQKSLRPAANTVRDVAKALAPVGPSLTRRSTLKSGDLFEEDHRGGTLREAIVVRTEKKKFQRNQAQLRIGVLHGRSKKGADAWYWRFVEFGTSQQKAQPFLVPAFESTKYALSGMIKDSLRKGIERQAKRLNIKKIKL